MKPIPDYGDVMPLEEFISCCKSGTFIDYDGYGYYATDTEMSDESIRPSDVKYRRLKTGYSHVVWFNR